MLIAALAFLAVQAGEPSCRTADPRVEELISSKAAELRGEEYCQFRLYHTIDDVDGDGQDDFLVVFTVEGLGGGGNDSAQYLAAFSSRSGWKPVVLKVARRGLRDITQVAVENGIISLTTAEHRKGDAMCCPSGKGQLRYELRGEHLEPLGPGRPTAGSS